MIPMTVTSLRILFFTLQMADILLTLLAWRRAGRTIHRRRFGKASDGSRHIRNAIRASDQCGQHGVCGDVGVGWLRHPLSGEQGVDPVAERIRSVDLLRPGVSPSRSAPYSQLTVMGVGQTP